jgi:hypothetical protein
MTRSGEEIDLVAPAREATELFIAECPEYLERYGEPGRQWCAHDLQHVLNWALIRSQIRFDRELDWLTRVLATRDFPLEWLSRGTQLLADVFERARPEMAETAERLRLGAARVQGLAERSRARLTPDTP